MIFGYFEFPMFLEVSGGPYFYVHYDIWIKVDMSHMNDFKIKTEMMNIEKSTCFERIDARKLMCVILIYSGGLSSMNVGVERVPGFVRVLVRL